MGLSLFLCVLITLSIAGHLFRLLTAYMVTKLYERRTNKDGKSKCDRQKGVPIKTSNKVYHIQCTNLLAYMVSLFKN